MKVTLLFKSNSNLKEVTLLRDQSVTIGRSDRCDVQVPDDHASSRHCRVSLLGDYLEVIDLSSKNGTYLNGIRVDQSQLFAGDKLKFGKTVMTLHQEDHSALEALTFPGRTQERMAFALKADFTGAREMNQSASSGLSISSSISEAHIREINIRKLAGDMHLSKEEIKKAHPFETGVALLIDIFLVLMIIPVTFICLDVFSPIIMPEDQKRIMIYVFQATLVLSFITYNYRVSKFTLGERITGIEGYYRKQ